MYSIGNIWLWSGFSLFILSLLCLDIIIFEIKKTTFNARQALYFTCFWITTAIIFGLFLWLYLTEFYSSAFATQKTLEFFTGYIIEESLSIDNLFIFFIIFQFFNVPKTYQRRVLLYGVLGAISMRLIMIILGTYLVSLFHWLLLVFGAFLVITGARLLWLEEHGSELNKNPLLRFMKRNFRVTEKFVKDRFIVRRHHKIYLTPLFLVLILIEFSDLLFALDSIPAIFAITTDVFIVFTSNIFAIMGLRALYFLLAHLANRFRYLQQGISLLLVFVGGKMLADPWYQLPIPWTLATICFILIGSILLSIAIPKKEK